MLNHLAYFGGYLNMPLNTSWHGINVLSILEICLVSMLLCTMLTGIFAVRKQRARLVSWALVGTILSATAAYAANTALSALTASGALAGANLIYVVQTVGSGGVKATMTQVATYINSLFSGDFTVTSGGTATLKNTGPGATGPIGSTTTVPVVTIDAQGRVTALTSATAAGTVSSVATACGNTGGPITTTGTVTAAITSRTVTGTTDTILSTDCGNIVYYNSASAVAVTQPAPTGSFAAGFFTTLCNINSATATVTPGSGTIGGGSTYGLIGGVAAAPACVTYQSDGTNFNLVPNWLVGRTSGALKANGSGVISQAACADLSNGTSLCSTTPGTGVATAAANNLSAAGGLTTTIASGTAALGTSLIGSGACATVVTVTATNVATTDTLSASFNSDPTAVTGYTPSASGMLAIIGYPTSGNVNFKVCNNTSGSITPGAVTLNWRVVR